MTKVLGAAILVFLLQSTASADDDVDVDVDEKKCVPPGKRALGGTMAVVPGLVVPGLGHIVAGDGATGRTLMTTGYIGLGGTVAAGTALFLTGASRRYVAPITMLAVSSVGLWLGSVIADLYGVVTGDSIGLPARSAPSMHAEVGYRYVYDPTASYRSFAVAELELRRGRLGVAPSAWIAVDDDNQRLRVAGSWRILGLAEGRDDARDGSYLELETALTHHRFGDEEFSTTMGEIFLGGRLDLARVGASLDGAFMELGTGYALGAVRYHDLTTEHTDLLLGRFSFGMYLGRGAGGAGEIAIEYDHRHDDFPAGLKMPGLGSGPAGHFGARLLLVRPSGWGIVADVQAGSAWVGGVSVVYRKGGRR